MLFFSFQFFLQYEWKSCEFLTFFFNHPNNLYALSLCSRLVLV